MNESKRIVVDFGVDITEGSIDPDRILGAITMLLKEFGVRDGEILPGAKLTISGCKKVGRFKKQAKSS